MAGVLAPEAAVEAWPVAEPSPDQEQDRAETDKEAEAAEVVLLRVVEEAQLAAVEEAVGLAGELEEISAETSETENPASKLAKTGTLLRRLNSQDCPNSASTSIPRRSTLCAS